MRTLNTKKRQIGYLIRRDPKKSWVKTVIKKNPGYTFRHPGPDYIYPKSKGPYLGSIRLGWVNYEDCKKGLEAHIQECKDMGIHVFNTSNFSIVKVIITEEKIYRQGE